MKIVGKVVRDSGHVYNKNNCYCMFCQSFFTNEERFSMVCPACAEKILKGDEEDETKDE